MLALSGMVMLVFAGVLVRCVCACRWLYVYRSGCFFPNLRARFVFCVFFLCLSAIILNFTESLLRLSRSMSNVLFGFHRILVPIA